jgi:hypothetical protein
LISNGGLTWASHPNAALRLRLAEYLSRGWAIETLEETSAIISRRKRISPVWALIQPMVTLFHYADRRRDRRLISVGPDDEIVERQL